MVSLSDAHYFEEMGVKKFEEIRGLLDSRESKNKLEGMKRLMAVRPVSDRRTLGRMWVHTRSLCG